MDILNNDTIKDRYLIFSRVASQELPITSKFHNEFVDEFNRTGSWNFQQLDNGFLVFQKEAIKLGDTIKTGLLILNELYFKLQEINSTAKKLKESDTFHYTIFRYDMSEDKRSKRVNDTLGNLMQSINFLLKAEKSTDRTNVPLLKSAVYLAMLSHVIRIETRGKALSQTMADITQKTDGNEGIGLKKAQEYLNIQYAGTKKSDSESIRDAIAHGQFRELSKQRIRFTVNRDGNEFDDTLNYSDILEMNNILELKIAIAEMYFFLISTANMVHLLDKEGSRKHRKKL